MAFQIPVIVLFFPQLALDRKQRSSTTNDGGTMKPSGDFVVMEAKELLKLFDASGKAAKGTVLQSMTAPGTNQVQWSLNTERSVFECRK